MIKILTAILIQIINILPDSPFQTDLGGQIFMYELLPYVNWFIPFDNCLKLVRLWIPCVILYYTYGSVKGVIDELVLKKIG